MGVKHGKTANAPAGLVTPLVALSLLPLLACSQRQPLSVTMVNPKTKVTVQCAARESDRPGVSREVLSAAVDACVKQLEARGFKRAD